MPYIDVRTTSKTYLQDWKLGSRLARIVPLQLFSNIMRKGKTINKGTVPTRAETL